MRFDIMIPTYINNVHVHRLNCELELPCKYK